MKTARLTGAAAAALLAGTALTAAPAAAQQNQTQNQQSQQQQAGKKQSQKVRMDGGPCQMGFAAADANSDDRVSRQEAGEFNKRRFQMLDADGDGELTREEYAQCLQMRTENVMDQVLGGKPAMGRDGNRMQRMGMQNNGNGKGRMGQGRQARMQGAGGGQMRDAVFDAVDADRDGSLSREEWASAATIAFDPWTPDATAGRKEGAQAEMQKRVEENDVNPREFGQALRAYIAAPPVPTVLKDRFGRNADEAAGQMSQEQVGEAAQMSFQQADRDASGEISMDEWRGSHPILGRRGALGSFEDLDLNGDGRVSSVEYNQVQDRKFGEIEGRLPDTGMDGQQGGVPVILYRLYVL